MHRPSRAGEAGFTLVELLVVLAVAGLLLLAAPALIEAARPNAQARVTALELAARLRSVRAEAIRIGRPVILVFDETQRRYMAASDGFSGRFPEGVSVRLVGLAPHLSSSVGKMVFYPDGSSSGGRIEVRSAHQHHHLVVHGLTGRIAIDE